MVSVIGKRLGTGFTVSILLMIASIFFGILSMHNVINNLKMTTQDQLGAAISTMDVRIHRLERNYALKNIILFGEDETVFKKYEDIFNEEYKLMYDAIQAAAKPLVSEAFNDEVRDNFIKFYDEIHEYDKAKDIKRSFKNSGQEQAIKELREDRDEAGILMDDIVESLQAQATINAQKYQKKANDVTKLLILLTIVSLFVSILIAFLVTHGIIKSVKYIHFTAAKIYGGELDLSIEIHAKNEFNDLAAAFDRMRKSLLRAKKMLERKEK